MTVWVDAQISPEIARGLREEFGYAASAVRDIGLRESEDLEIFTSARDADAIVITKDRDFVSLVNRFGPPPRIIWLTCGNTSNSRLKEILTESIKDALEPLKGGEAMVEISSPR